MIRASSGNGPFYYYLLRRRWQDAIQKGSSCLFRPGGCQIGGASPRRDAEASNFHEKNKKTEKNVVRFLSADRKKKRTVLTR